MPVVSNQRPATTSVTNTVTATAMVTSTAKIQPVTVIPIVTGVTGPSKGGRLW
jgi:hypothetical protein